MFLHKPTLYIPFSDVRFGVSAVGVDPPLIRPPQVLTIGFERLLSGKRATQSFDIVVRF